MPDAGSLTVLYNLLKLASDNEVARNVIYLAAGILCAKAVIRILEPIMKDRVIYNTAIKCAVCISQCNELLREIASRR